MPTKQNGSGGQQPYDENTGRFAKRGENSIVKQRYIEKGFTREEANQLGEDFSDERLNATKKLLDKGYTIKELNNLDEKEVVRLARDKYDYKTKTIEWEETPNGRIPKNGIFDTDTLGGYSQYSEDLADKKNIIQMTPKEYFKLCAQGFQTTYEEQIKQVEAEREHLDFLEDVILEDNKQFPMPYIDMEHPKYQEGRHRMYVAGELFGWDTKQPVLATNDSKTKFLTDEAREKYNNEYSEYFRAPVDIKELIEDGRLLKQSSTLETRKTEWGDSYKDYKFDENKYDKDIDHPIRIAIKNGKYFVEDGRHRLIALNNDGYKKVEALIKL